MQELEVVHSEVLAEVRTIAFRDYAREFLDDVGKLRTPAGESNCGCLRSCPGNPSRSNSFGQAGIRYIAFIGTLLPGP